MKTALLLSGGMDSVAIAWWKRPDIAITIDYGHQPALAEIRAAGAVAAALEIEHHIVRCDLAALGSGDMAGRTPLVMAPVPEWWPFRNQMLLTVAAMKAVSLGVERLLIGCLSTDRQHGDGTEAFISAMNSLFAVQEGGLMVEAPAIALTAEELIQQSSIPFEVLAWAHSCHRANEACGNCRGCLKHYSTMQALGHDPY
ncbi:7-cyano-7-deazaguanine synthase [Methylocystis sp. H62]|uniref:7-cyano-7-deazaguanine synthase n=1 Tax=Methylocystis sp. H62 TaxID=2785789 RepID=UPI0018C2F723|nr:7-cyano-7-deazaguanine synthase [Methylocystis sp. H62]MBG0794052.1 7-cyano-7-deazaguanine synthase [Methylocystis sp. H62]